MRLTLALISLVLLAGCGFRPVYGVNRDTPVGVESRLAQVEIGDIPDREGQFLRNALIDRFYRDGRPTNPHYVLTSSTILETLTDLDITKAANATRGQLRLDTNFSLTDTVTGQTVLNRTVTSITSYNILGSEFATRVTEENARENALNDLARQVEMQVSLYFKRLDAGTEKPEPVKPPMRKFDVFDAPGLEAHH